MCRPHDILREVIIEHTDADKWVGASFEAIKRLSNSKVGDVGQEFVERLCRCLGIDIAFPETGGKRKRQSPWDMRIEGITFELKTATEDVRGAFQFNHIRYHRPYEAVLCIGISPENIHFGAWTKADMTTGKAGTLATMEKGANASFKLTKTPSQLRPISDFESAILDLVTKPNA